jgi:hypothetical protein
MGSVLDIHSVVGLQRIFLQAFGNLDSITDFAKRNTSLTRFVAVLNNSGITLISRVEPKKISRADPESGTAQARNAPCSGAFM